MKTDLTKLDSAGIEEAIEYLKSKRGQQLGSETSEKMLGPNPFVGLSQRSVLDTARLAWWQTIKNPKNFLRHGFSFAKEAAKSVVGESDLTPDPRDRRFADVSWKDNPFLRTWLQIYLAGKRELDGWIEDEEIHEYDKDRLKFIASLVADGIAPSNTIMNPTALKRIVETGGASAIKGVKNLAADLKNNFGLPSSVDKSAFKVGQNIAQSPGVVVYRNDVLELIQYQPPTKKVSKRPILFVPPQINKYYIFDLSEHNSIARFMLSQGLQLFAISWKNPTPKQRHWNMTTYINAIENAIEAISSITRSKDLNVLAGCSGGVTMVSLLGYYAAKKIKTVRSATLVVTVYDMDASVEIPMALFADHESIKAARKLSARKGVLDGREMARIFSWMRPNDLIWNYWINNYLLGNSPPAFDILYWNADTTCLPAEFHGEILDMFESNILVKPGEMKIKDAFIDLGQIECDTYTVAGTTDHICPWRASYRSAQHLGGTNEFVLSASGHMQSLLNLPGNPKASYYLNPEYEAEDPDQWYKGAAHTKGSWWDHWAKWILERSGDTKKTPAKLGNQNYRPLCDAPGAYVFE